MQTVIDELEVELSNSQPTIICTDDEVIFIKVSRRLTRSICSGDGIKLDRLFELGSYEHIKDFEGHRSTQRIQGTDN